MKPALRITYEEREDGVYQVEVNGVPCEPRKVDFATLTVCDMSKFPSEERSLRPISTGVMEHDPTHFPLFNRLRRFSQEEAMEWYLSGRPEEPQVVKGLLDTIHDCNNWEREYLNRVDL